MDHGLGATARRIVADTCEDRLVLRLIVAGRNTDLITGMALLNAYRQRCEARPALKKALDRQMADFVDAAPAAVLELSCRHRLLAAIIVEAALGLAAQPARLDVFNQQRASSIFRIGQPLVQ